MTSKSTSKKSRGKSSSKYRSQDSRPTHTIMTKSRQHTVTRNDQESTIQKFSDFKSSLIGDINHNLNGSLNGQELQYGSLGSTQKEVRFQSDVVKGKSPKAPVNGK